MPIYDYSCSNHTKPIEFEQHASLIDFDKMPKCPKCNKNNKVKKIIKTAFPVSQSWKVG